MTAAVANRRRSRRAPLKQMVRLECRKGTLGLGKNLAVAALDLSETGVRVLLSDTVSPGQEVEVLLSGIGHAKATRRVGRVVWAVATADHLVGVGIAFEKALPYVDVQRLHRPLA
jgi:hypothetical protein